jgi:hypothetical protein
MPIHYDIETDSLYQKGLKKAEAKGFKTGFKIGVEQEKRATILRSWQHGIAIAMIANITDLPIPEIEKEIKSFQSKT